MAHTSHKTDIVIPIMGPTGAGKSSFINYLWDANYDGIKQGKVNVGHTLTSCTSDIQAVVLKQTKSSWELKSQVVILDTPGFDDTYVGDVEILRRISKWLEVTYKEKKILAGVIYLHDLSQDRFTGTAKRNLEMFRKLCGDDALKKTVLVTTKWSSVDNQIERAREKRKEDELRDVHWKELRDNGCKMKRFERSQNSAQEVLEVFFGKTSEARRIGVAQVALQIQNELVVKRRILPQTAAGRELRYTLDEVLKMQREMVALESQDRENMDEQTKKRLEEMEAQMGNLMNQVKALKIPLGSKIRRMLGMLGGGKKGNQIEGELRELAY